MQVGQLLASTKNILKSPPEDRFVALPDKFLDAVAKKMGLEKPCAEYSFKDLELISNAFKNWEFEPLKTEGFKKAEVTVGGVDTDELNSKTMEAKKAPGLFFVGEVVDVTGWLGGYNFQWAWASAYVAAQAIVAAKYKEV